MRAYEALLSLSSGSLPTFPATASFCRKTVFKAVLIRSKLSNKDRPFHFRKKTTEKKDFEVNSNYDHSRQSWERDNVLSQSSLIFGNNPDQLSGLVVSFSVPQTEIANFKHDKDQEHGEPPVG